MNKDSRNVEPSFGDFTDGRRVGDWKTRYSDWKVHFSIVLEGIYLIVWLVGALVISFFLGCEKKLFLFPMALEQYNFFSKYIFAVTGGVVGSTIFGLKWLVHVVAHGYWHEDRRAWRILLPFSSAAIALVFVVIVESNILNILNPEVITHNNAVFGLSCLVGLFSDRVLVKLNDVANSLFGSSKKLDNGEPQRAGDSS